MTAFKQATDLAAGDVIVTSASTISTVYEVNGRDIHLVEGAHPLEQANTFKQNLNPGMMNIDRDNLEGHEWLVLNG